MTTQLWGPSGPGSGALVEWSLTRDDAGYREYNCTHQVRGDIGDGPFQVLSTPGLPVPGTAWNFRNDFDPWVWCLPGAQVDPMVTTRGPTRYWLVQQKFSNKPLPTNQQRCNNLTIQNPLLEPPKISGGGVKFTEEGVFDRNGEKITNSAFELIRGSVNEWDDDRPTITIQQNVATATLGYVLPYLMANKVNSVAMWGFPTRTIKLSGWKWTRQFYGQCLVYYQRTLTFEIAPITGSSTTWDKVALDEGTKVLSGRWAKAGDFDVWQLVDVDGEEPDPTNPAHFIQFQDKNGNLGKVLLDGAGLPANTMISDQIGTGTGTAQTTGDPANITIEYYPEDDFQLLQVPLTF